MSNLRDDGSAAPGSAGESGTFGATQPRKPRIEVLRSASAAIPAPGLAQSSGKTSNDTRSAASLDAFPAEPSRIGPDQRQQAASFPARRRRGLFGSRTILLILLAAAVIAGSLLYTYISSERDAAEYVGDKSKASSDDSKPRDGLQVDRELAKTPDSAGPIAAVTIEELAPEPTPEVASAPGQAAALETRQAVDERPKVPPRASDVVSGNGNGASKAVLAFYSALSAGDGASAAQLVIPEKRQSGPLSAGALSRYYSSFRRPLRVRSVAQMDARTTRVAYDYVLADGRLCRGEAAVEVAQRDGRSLVSRIRTRGPC